VSIKDGLKYAKQELSSDEKALESVFKLERFYKKHKNKIIVLLVLVIVAFVYTLVNAELKEKRLEKANIAYIKLQEDPNDKEALESLKENNQPLYELISYHEAKVRGDIQTLKSLESADNELVASLSKYAYAMLENTPKDSLIYADYSKLAQAYELMKKNEYTQATDILSTIDNKSPASMIALLLQHSMIKKGME
jgi:hypothetical protein